MRNAIDKNRKESMRQNHVEVLAQNPKEGGALRNNLTRYVSETRLKSWNEAIEDRYSVRSYKRKAVSKDTLRSIEDLLGGFSPLCKGAKGYLVGRGAPKVFTGLLGPLGRVTNPPSAAVFVGDVHLPGHMEAVGYLGEGVVLEATSLGLGTCWIAGSFSKKRAVEKVELGPGWKAIAATPLGYEAEKPTLSETALKALARSDTRRPVDELVSGLQRKRWPRGLEGALEAARWAPSAANRQPWRFRVDIDGVTLSADSVDVRLTSLKRLDCGIAMLHFEVACIAAGITGCWKFPKPGSHSIAKYVYS